MTTSRPNGSKSDSSKGTMHGSAMTGDGMAHGYRAKAASPKPPKSSPKSSAKPPTPPAGQGGGSK